MIFNITKKKGKKKATTLPNVNKTLFPETKGATFFEFWVKMVSLYKKKYWI